MRYTAVHLMSLLNEVGEADTKAVLSGFVCPLAPDVEIFIQRKAIDFARHGWAQTHLIFAPDNGGHVLVGYFTLASKIITVPVKNITKNTKKRIAAFSTYDSAIDAFYLSAPLIAQLGKNYYAGYNKLISGSDLLKIACDKVSKIQLDLGGRFAYVECEDKPALVGFYKNHGFYEFDRRYLDADETDLISGKYLVQLLRHFKPMWSESGSGSSG